jgi:hypothetical protein
LWQDGKVGKVIVCLFSGKESDTVNVRAVPSRKNCGGSEGNPVDFLQPISNGLLVRPKFFRSCLLRAVRCEEGAQRFD